MMARKIIKGILFVLAAVVVGGGIMTYLRSQKKINPAFETSKSETGQQQPKSELQQMVVKDQGSTVQVQIPGIMGRNYSIQNLSSGNGFRIQVPNAQIDQVQKMLDQPHPLIKKIEVRESSTDASSAELIFYTEKNVNFLDTQKDGKLIIDFVQAEPEEAPEPAVVSKPTPAPVAKAPTTSSSSTKSNAATTAKKIPSKKPAKKTTVAKKPAKKKAKSAATDLQPFDASEFDAPVEDNALTAQEKAPTIQDERNDLSMNMSSLGSAPATESIGDSNEPPMIDVETPPAKEEDDGFTLKDVVKEEKAAPAGNANLLDQETQFSLSNEFGVDSNKVASVPQADQKFDLNKVQANLPYLQNMVVQKSGASTMVTFDREKNVPFKVFRMVNPSRIVIDFKDARSKLKPDYPRFTGTKISRAETREYAGPDGMLVRVILYVDGAPNYTSNKSGNQLVLEIK
jgi:hypothetical protein